MLTPTHLVANLSALTPQTRTALVDLRRLSAELDVAIEPDGRAEVEQRRHDIAGLERRHAEAMLVFRPVVTPLPPDE